MPHAPPARAGACKVDAEMARRGLKWWFVAWLHAILMENIMASRRALTGASASELGHLAAWTSRWTEFYQSPFNVTCLRVLLSPCQFYVDKSQRAKGDLHAKNGLWCGISPENVGAAWVWNGSKFLTVEHGDIRTNEW